MIVVRMLYASVAQLLANCEHKEFRKQETIKIVHESLHLVVSLVQDCGISGCLLHCFPGEIFYLLPPAMYSFYFPEPPLGQGYPKLVTSAIGSIF